MCRQRVIIEGLFSLLTFDDREAPVRVAEKTLQEEQLGMRLKASRNECSQPTRVLQRLEGIRSQLIRIEPFVCMNVSRNVICLARIVSCYRTILYNWPLELLPREHK
jgi:hypothetical protein